MLIFEADGNANVCVKRTDSMTEDRENMTETRVDQRMLYSYLGRVALLYTAYSNARYLDVRLCWSKIYGGVTKEQLRSLIDRGDRRRSMKAKRDEGMLWREFEASRANAEADGSTNRGSCSRILVKGT